MRSEASAPKARRLTAHTRQNHTHRGAEKREAPSERGKPGFLPPVGGKGPGGQGYVHHIVLMPLGPPPNLSSPSGRFFPRHELTRRVELGAEGHELLVGLVGGDRFRLLRGGLGAEGHDLLEAWRSRWLYRSES